MPGLADSAASRLALADEFDRLGSLDQVERFLSAHGAELGDTVTGQLRQEFRMYTLGQATRPSIDTDVLCHSGFRR